MRGSISIIVAVLALVVITTGIVAGRQLVEIGGRFLPRATSEQTVVNYYLPSVDTYVSQGDPVKNFGKETIIELSSRNGNIKEGYMGFNITKVNGTITKAELKLTATNEDKKNGAKLFLTDSNWNEAIAYNSRPLRQGGIIADTENGIGGRKVSFDLTNIIKGNGLYSFGMVYSNSDSVIFHSKDTTDNLEKPTLIITYIPIPTATITKTPTLTSSIRPSLTSIPIPSIPPAISVTITLTQPSKTPSPSPTVISTPTVPTITPILSVTQGISVTPALGCSESDGGIDIFEKGQVQGYFENGSQGAYTDSCVSNQLCLMSQTSCPSANYVNEGYCSQDQLGRKFIESILKACPGNCLNGACVIPSSPTLSPTSVVSLTPTNTGGLIPGDANEDRKVDGIDYTIWSANYGQSVTDKHKSGDFNGDGKVDGIDYIIWFSNFSSNTTPTP